MSAYRTLADLSDAVDEFLLGDAHAKNHLAPNIIASMRAMPAVNVQAFASERVEGTVIDIGNGRLVALRPCDFGGRN